MQGGKQLPLAQWDRKLQVHLPSLKTIGELIKQGINPLARQRGNRNRLRKLPRQTLGRVTPFLIINLIKNIEHRLFETANLFEYFVHRLNLHIDLRVRGIDDVYQQIRFHHFFQRGFKRVDQMVRKFLNKSDRIGHQHRLMVGQLHLSRRWVKRGKQLILHKDVRTGEAIQQRRLPRIRISHNRHQRPAVTAAPSALLGPANAHQIQITFKRPKQILNTATVHLQLGFTRSAQTNPALLTLQVGPHISQTW